MAPPTGLAEVPEPITVGSTVRLASPHPEHFADRTVADRFKGFKRLGSIHEIFQVSGKYPRFFGNVEDTFRFLAIPR